MKQLFIFFALIFLLSCKSNNSRYHDVEDNILADSISIEVNLFVPDSEIYPLLDSIIMSLNNCPKPKGKIIEMVVLVEEHGNDYIISMSTISDYHWDYTLSKGVFEHMNYRFYYTGSLLDDFFKPLDSLVKIVFINPKKLVFDIDDRNYQWIYILQDGNIEGILAKDCNKVWVNWDYYPGED